MLCSRHQRSSLGVQSQNVFYYSPISHVGMYIGHGMIVNAENPSAGIRVTGLHTMPYVGAVRPG